MKEKYLIISLVVLLVLSYSCAPVYRCGEPRPDKTPLTWSKNLKTVIRERDWLCSSLEEEEKENESLREDIKGLNGEIAELSAEKDDLTARLNDTQKKYDDLFNESLTQAERLSTALALKSEELDAKERLLTEREKSLEEMRQRLATQDSIASRLNSILHDALLGFDSDELSVEIHEGKVYVSMSDNLLFRSGSATVESKGKEALELLADVLDKNRDIDILVEGHTDNVPIKTAVYKDNWDLSVARATSIVRILTDDYKISPLRMTASGRGEFSPRASNDTAEGRSKNRRTEIILSPKLEEILRLINN